METKLCWTMRNSISHVTVMKTTINSTCPFWLAVITALAAVHLKKIVLGVLPIQIMTKIFMELLKQLVKNVLPLIKRKKHHYRVHMVIFRLFLFSIPVQEFKKKPPTKSLFVALSCWKIILVKIHNEHKKVHQGKMGTHIPERKWLWSNSTGRPWGKSGRTNEMLICTEIAQKWSLLPRAAHIKCSQCGAGEKPFQHELMK